MTLGRWFWPAIAALLLLTRLAHLNVLWVEEAYPLAAARQMLAGHALYRDVWFDKPPLFAAIYTLWGAQDGWLLRLAGAAFSLFTCWAVARAASALASHDAARWAALLCAVALAFGVPSATLALTPDALLMPFHALAVAFAVTGSPFAAGCLAGIGLLFNTKALFVLAAVLLWQWPRPVPVLAGFASPVLLAAAALALQRSLSQHWEQVWVWGSLYARNTPFASPVLEGFKRTLNWAGFHATAFLAALTVIPPRRDRARLASWLVLSAIAAWLGWRFFPRYYFHLLVPVTVLGGIGLARLSPLPRRVLLALLLVPVIRFAPSHWRAFTQPEAWSDLALFQDARRASALIRAAAQPGDSLFVWGYRPEFFPLTRLPAGTPFLDSQPISGVFADRHLTSAAISAPQWTAAARTRLLATRPTFLVDALGPLNPALALDRQPYLQPWLAHYRKTSQTPLSVIYRLHD